MPKSVPVSVRLDPETFRAAQEVARRTSRPLSSVVSELAAEALKMRRHAGIIFAGPPGDRRARVAGTGLDVWEMITVYRSCKEDTQKTLQLLEHVSARELESALRYYRAYPKEIDVLIAENEQPAKEWGRLYPHISPAQERS